MKKEKKKITNYQKEHTTYSDGWYWIEDKNGNIILNTTDVGTFLFGIFNNGSRLIITAPTEAL